MMRMGPEALLVTSANTAQRNLTEFTRLEYTRAEAPRMQASLLRDFEAMPTKRFAARDLFRWGTRLFRRERAEARSVRSRAVDGVAETAARGRSVTATSLAALPAVSGARDFGSATVPMIALLGRA